MPKINVYLPDALAAAVKEANVPVSAVCQAALSDAVKQVDRSRRAIAALRDPATPAAVLAQIDQAIENRMTARLSAALQAAGAGPAGQAREVVGSLDLLRGLLGDEENLAVRLLVSQGADIDALAAVADASPAGEQQPAVPGGHGGLLGRLTMPARSASAAALEAAMELGHNYIGCEHLLIGLATSDGPAGELLARQGIAAASLRQAVSGALAGVIHEQRRSAQVSAAGMADILRRLEAVEQRLAGADQL